MTEHQPETQLTWPEVREAANALAGKGAAREGLEIMLRHLDPAHFKLSEVMQYGLRHGLVEDVRGQAEFLLGHLKKGAFTNMHCAFFGLEVFRRLNMGQAYLSLLDLLDEEALAFRLFYVSFAQALHDELFFTEIVDDPRFERLFFHAVTQTHMDKTNSSNEFLNRKAHQFVIARPAFTEQMRGHVALFRKIEDRLDNTSKDVFITRFLLNLEWAVDVPAAVAALNASTVHELRAVFSVRRERLDELAALLRGTDDYVYAVQHLEPHVILMFAKCSAVGFSKDFAEICDLWIRNLPHRYPTAQALDAIGRSADQLVLVARETHPEILDWYIAHRSEADALRALKSLRAPFARKAPALQGNRKPRIAVCISGQLRGFRRAFPTVREHLLHDVEPVIFLDTWEKIGRKIPTPAQANRVFPGAFVEAYQKVADALGWPAMQTRYRALIQLQDSNVVTVPELAAFYGCPETHIRLEDDETEAFASMNNPSKMYHKIGGCHDLMLDSGLEFDMILRIRPDKSVTGRRPGFDWQLLVSKSAEDGVIHMDMPFSVHPTVGFVVGDQVAMAPQGLMDVYANAAVSTAEVADLNWEDWPATARPHLNIAHALWIRGIPVEVLPIDWGHILDPSPLEPHEVRALLEQDTKGRPLDAHDRLLIAAAEASLGASA